LLSAVASLLCGPVKEEVGSGGQTSAS
jgi:hypothetical protein